MDTFGNILSPTSIAMPILRLRGRELRTTHESQLDGTHRLVVELLDGDAKPKGKSAQLAARAKFDGPEGAFEVEAGETLRLSLDVAGQLLPVSTLSSASPKESEWLSFTGLRTMRSELSVAANNNQRDQELRKLCYVLE